MRLFTAQLPTHEKSLEHAAAYALLTHAVEVIYHMPLPDIARDSHGKPYFPAHPEICFNLSHCRGLAACGISDAVLGVDCESVLCGPACCTALFRRMNPGLCWKAPCRTNPFSGSGR